MLQIGQTAPNFLQESTEGPIEFHKWIEGSWATLFSHPRNFTPVCTTELGEVARLHLEWSKRGVKVIGPSVHELDLHDNWASPRRWISDPAPIFQTLASSTDMKPGRSSMHRQNSSGGDPCPSGRRTHWLALGHGQRDGSK
jgi:hypothetical protein